MLQEQMDFIQKFNTWTPVEKLRVPHFRLQRAQIEEKKVMDLIGFHID